jgi:hypothetical protein
MFKLINKILMARLTYYRELFCFWSAPLLAQNLQLKRHIIVMRESMTDFTTQFIKNPAAHHRTKHICALYLFIREAVEAGEVTIQ